MIAEGVLKIGQSVAKQVALHWLAEKKADSRRGRDLTRLVQARFPIRRKERDVLEALYKVEDDVANQLQPELARAAYGLPDNEREAAFAAVSDALEDADLSDDALFAVDVDPGALAAAVRKQFPVNRAGLSEQAVRLYDTALDHACIVLVHLIKELPEFDAAVAVENLGRLRTVVEGMDELLARIPTPELSAPSGRNLDEEFRARYLERAVRSYDKLEVIGLTTHSYEPRTTLSVAYLSLSVTADQERPQKSRRHEEIDWLNHDPGRLRSADNLRVEVALGDSRLTVVRGEAGAGKSTLLRWLAVNAARSAFTSQLQEWNDCVPFLVKLRDFATGALPRGDALLEQPSSPQCGPVPSGWVHRQFESGAALLLVDGVDELVAKRRAAVRQWLQELLSSYPELRVVVTSRPTAVGSKWLAHEGFRSVVLEPMTPADVQIFLRRWHAALLDSTPDPDMLPCRPEDIPEHQRTLLAQLQARAHLRALARSPLLCAMLCVLNLDRRSRLPRDRVALYSAALDMLLERRDADRNVAAGEEILASANEKLVLLQVLAWWLNENGRTDMSREQALARMTERLRGMPNIREDATTLLDHLIDRSGVIRQPVHGRIDFIHRTFQEFLAAREAVDRDSIDMLVRHAKSDLWRETVLMACAQGSAEQRGRLLNGILNQAAESPGRVARQLNLLAAACKETAVLAPPEVLDRVDECIRGLIPPRSVRESRSLATVGESVLDYLPSSLADLSDAQAVACARTAALVNGPRAIEVLRRYASVPSAKITDEVVRAWQYFDPETYARRVLADAPLTLGPTVRRVDVNFAGAVPFLHLLRNLRTCWVNLWGNGDIADEVGVLGDLHQLTELVLLGDSVPETLPALGSLRKLEYLFINISDGWPASVDFLADLVDLHTLALINADGLADFSFLGSLVNLNTIWLGHNPVAEWMDEVSVPEKVDSIGFGRIQETKELCHIANRFINARVAVLYACLVLDDLRSLSRLPLESVEFADCGEVDISGIADVPTLTRIRISGRSKIDLRPLAGRKITISLGSGVHAVGADMLGPEVNLYQPPR